ncbi:MAG: replication initiator [Acidimicrobiales bacterium]
MRQQPIARPPVERRRLANRRSVPYRRQTTTRPWCSWPRTAEQPGRKPRLPPRPAHRREKRSLGSDRSSAPRHHRVWPWEWTWPAPPTRSCTPTDHDKTHRGQKRRHPEGAECRERFRLIYVRVAEFQRREAVHLHVIVRLDAVDGEVPDAASELLASH